MEIFARETANDVLGWQLPSGSEPFYDWVVEEWPTPKLIAA
jgi:hypothetical protein